MNLLSFLIYIPIILLEAELFIRDNTFGDVGLGTGMAWEIIKVCAKGESS